MPLSLNNFIMKFNKFLNTHVFDDLGHDGIPFTWPNNQKGKRKVLSRLDRVVANCKWIFFLVGQQ